MELSRTDLTPTTMMASYIFSTVPSATEVTTNNFSHSSIFSKTSTHRFKYTHENQTHRFKVSCNKTSDDKYDTLETSLDKKNVDRRNLLLGLGGTLYGAANLTFLPSAFSVPIAAPNVSDCAIASKGIHNIKDAVRGVACCPPVLTLNSPKNYVFPKETAVRIRPAAQRASDDYIDKYKAAIKAMRDLPDDHPHSFKQQAKIHCAYCNGSYTQKESGKEYEHLTLQIHNSWLFFPFHRWYLYFYERILGKLIDDPTFAIPYWNWDNPTGMIIPDLFEKPIQVRERKENPVFDAYRDARHLPPALVDIDYNGEDRGVSCIDQITINLSAMYKQMISNASDPTSFFGGRYVAGMDHDDKNSHGNPSVGSIEAGCHTAVHRWVADPRMPNNEDMGNFYSAGYDPIFYAHHANVDRMWKIWKELGIRGHREPTDKDWLDASYVFYDENEELVRVYNRDCVDLNKLNYDYETSRIPWARNRPIPRAKNPQMAARSARMGRSFHDVQFPVKLDGIVKVLVKRPYVNRTKEEKEKANEILMLNGICFDSEKFVKFDVYVDDKDDEPETTAADSEFAGSFAQLPHHQSGEKMFMTSAARFGLTELLEDIEAEDDESIMVTLVPRTGSDDITISEIKIELVPIV
ncbi:polyphenol oxidase I, chloroplastic [Lactuca sativa]|uniref:polyphenol oxidase I, chloroplastic n=1 Tax=Lactuca sativa TaxID=4236 RepID=UPI000CD9209D|nr:polyphenol oxidase I, chloroplastic [Lactuca sativa]